MKIRNKKDLTAEQFVWHFFVEERVYIPPIFCLADKPDYYSFTIDSLEFLNSDPFSLWYTDKARKQWLDPFSILRGEHPDLGKEDLYPVSYPELLTLNELLITKLSDLKEERKERRERSHPKVISMLCRSCNRRVLLDGNSGFLNLCVRNDHQDLHVFETAHHQWEPYFGRVMSGVCNCKRNH